MNLKMFRTAVSGLFACTLFICSTGCGSSESEVMIKPEQAVDIQAQRDARDAAALKQDKSGI